MTSDVDILHELNVTSVPPIVNFTFAAITALDDLWGIGTITSLLSALIVDYTPTYSDALEYAGGTNWTVTYVQIYDTTSNSWTARSSVEYVKMRYFIDYRYYNASTNQYEEYSTNGTYGTSYSTHYYDSSWCKDAAVQAYIYGYRWYDTIESVDYKVGNTVVLTHERWSEYWGYEP